MKTNFLPFLAGLAIFIGACEKNPIQVGSGSDAGEVGTYVREGDAPFTITATSETRTFLGDENTILWDEGDKISLFKEGDVALKLLDAGLIGEMSVGEKKSILLVNPSNDGGYFMGFDSSNNAIVRNSEGLNGDNLKGGSITADVAEANLNTIYGLAGQIGNDPVFVFTLEKVDEGWLLYHKASGTGLSTHVGASTSGRFKCIFDSQLGAVDIVCGANNVAGSSNSVTGREEQIWIKRVGGDQDGWFLWSGGRQKPVSWNSLDSQWTNWLFFELSDSAFQFTADESGASSTFTNNTGFSAGDDQWFAIYPSVSSPSCTGGVVSFTLPEVQFYQPDSFGADSNVSVGILQDDRVFFRNVCGILKLSILGTQRVKSITVTDKKGASLWGTATLDSSSIDSGDCSASVSGGNDRITLISNSGVKLQEEVATDFYLVVPVGAFSEGFDVEIVTTTGTFTRSTSKDNTIKRSDIKKMPVFTLKESGTEIPTVNVENAAVQAYMANGTYEYFGASTSFLDQSEVRSLKSSLGTNSDKPAGYTVTWDSSASASITVADGGNTWFTEENISGGTYTITNLTPGHTYTYQVEEDGTVVAEGEFQATGQVRMVSIPDAWNCRMESLSGQVQPTMTISMIPTNIFSVLRKRSTGSASRPNWIFGAILAFQGSGETKGRTILLPWGSPD